MTLKPVLVLFLLLGLCAGCLQPNSRETRTASFAPYREVKIGESSAGKFLVERTAFLAQSDEATIAALSQRGPQAFDLLPRLLGLATAVDRRGYLITAGHCVRNVEKGLPLYIVYVRDGHWQWMSVRVAWCGSLGKFQPDLAVLRATGPCEKAFDWSPEVKEGSEVIVAGHSRVGYNNHVIDGMAGKILDLKEKSTGAPAYTIISHSAPLHPGDGGGPVVTPDGHLLGINVQSTGLQWKRPTKDTVGGYALRPEMEVLIPIIDQDFLLSK